MTRKGARSRAYLRYARASANAAKRGWSWATQRDFEYAALRSTQVGSGEARLVREVAMIANVGPPSILAEHRRRAGPLLVGVLDHDNSAGPQQSASARLDDPDHVQPILPGPQRDRGIVLRNLRVAYRRVEWHVRRVADDQVYLAVQLREAGGDVAVMEGDPVTGSVGRVDVALHP